MGQEVSVTCPVCKTNRATYKDIFEAEGIWPMKNYGLPNELIPEEYVDRMFRELNIAPRLEKEEFKLPPFERFLGPDCLKYLFKEDPSYKKEENISYWLFYSCEDCINIGDPERKNKFYIHDPKGVTRWISQLP